MSDTNDGGTAPEGGEREGAPTPETPSAATEQPTEPIIGGHGHQTRKLPPVPQAPAHSTYQSPPAPGPSGASGTPYGAPPSGGSPYGPQYSGPGYSGPRYSGQQYPGPQYPGPQYPQQGYPQPGAPYPLYRPAEPTGLSIASMICGIASMVGFAVLLLPQVAAVVLGHLALSREPAGRGFAIAGLVMGYLAILITIVVIAFFIIGLASISRYNGY